MNEEQSKRFHEMVRLEHIDIVREEVNLYKTGIREMVICYRAFPGGKAFYDNDEWEFLKEIGLVEDE